MNFTLTSVIHVILAKIPVITSLPLLHEKQCSVTKTSSET